MKTNETGHYKNVVNLEKLKVFAEGLGAGYTPQKDSLKFPAVVLLVTETHVLHDAVRNQINTVSLSVDNRQLVYEPIKKLGTKVMNTMGSTNVKPKTIEDAKFFNAKIQGTRIEKPAAAQEGEKEHATNSVSRQSYDSLYENFKSLVDLLQQDGDYAPLEADVNIAGLTAKLNEMKTANQDVTTQSDNLGKKRITRNSRFYLNDDGLLTVAKGIKKYIRGKFGIQSPEFSQIKDILIRDLKMK